MPIIQIQFEEDILNEITDIAKKLKDEDEILEVNQSIDKAIGALVLLGLKVAAVTIPLIINIIRKIKDKKATVKFNCPESNKKVKISISGIKDEKQIKKIVNNAYKTSCG